MTLNLHSDRTALRVTLDDIVDAHGPWPVLRALVVRPFRRNRPLPPLRLNAHLRRDIGLPPLEDGGPPWGQPR